MRWSRSLMIMSIHPTALVGPKVELGLNCSVGPFSVLAGVVVLGENSVVESHCLIGSEDSLETLAIGSGALIRSHSVLYSGSRVGKKFQTGHHVTVRANSEIGENVSIGSYSDVQGDCLLGNNVRLHSDVHVCSGSRLGDGVWLFPRVTLTNDARPPSNLRTAPVIEEFAVLTVGVTIMPGVTVSSNAVVLPNSLVNKFVPEGSLMLGSPAKKIGLASDLLMPDGSRAYPWQNRYSREP